MVNIKFCTQIVYKLCTYWVLRNCCLNSVSNGQIKTVFRRMWFCPMYEWVLPRILVLNTSFGGSEDFSKTGLNGALYSPKRRDCPIAMGNIFNGQNSILFQAAQWITLWASRKEIESETKGSSRRPRPKHSCVFFRQIFAYWKMFQIKVVGLNYEDFINYVDSILRWTTFEGLRLFCFFLF